MKEYNKWLSRTWLCVVFSMAILALSILWTEIKQVAWGLDTEWIMLLVPFCSGSIGAYIGLEKLIDRERARNGNE